MTTFLETIEDPVLFAKLGNVQNHLIQDFASYWQYRPADLSHHRKLTEYRIMVLACIFDNLMMDGTWTDPDSIVLSDHLYSIDDLVGRAKAFLPYVHSHKATKP